MTEPLDAALRPKTLTDYVGQARLKEKLGVYLQAARGRKEALDHTLLFGPPGGGKSHLSAAIGLALVESGWRVLFQRTTDLVQRLQVARRELALEAALAKLDRYDLLILDDIAYVSKDQAETSVLFELIAAR